MSVVLPLILHSFLAADNIVDVVKYKLKLNYGRRSFIIELDQLIIQLDAQWFYATIY